jgi:hypothetical protein
LLGAEIALPIAIIAYRVSYGIIRANGTSEEAGRSIELAGLMAKAPDFWSTEPIEGPLPALFKAEDAASICYLVVICRPQHPLAVSAAALDCYPCYPASSYFRRPPVTKASAVGENDVVNFPLGRDGFTK